MALTFRFGGNVSASPVDLTDDRVRLPMPPLTEMAYGLAIGTSTITFDDPDGDFTVPALRGFRANEDDCSGAVRLYTGFIAGRTVQHQASLISGSARVWTTTVNDFNGDASRVILRGSGAVRPAETDIDRITWYLGSGFSVNIADYGLVDTSNPVMMAPADYSGRRPVDMLTDCMNASGKNAFIYYPDTAGPDDLTNALAYFTATDNIYVSTLSFTSVPGEYDYSTVWPVEKYPTGDFDPSRVNSGIYLRWSGGALFKSLTSTYNAFYQKETSIDEPDVNDAATAEALLDRYLADAAEEELTITFSVWLPSTHVNLINRGQATQVHFPEIPGYVSPAYVRVIRRTVKQITKAGTPVTGWYEVELECKNPKFVGGYGQGVIPPSAGGSNNQLPPPTVTTTTTILTCADKPPVGDAVASYDIVVTAGVPSPSDYLNGWQTTAYHPTPGRWITAQVIETSGVMDVVDSAALGLAPTSSYVHDGSGNDWCCNLGSSDSGTLEYWRFHEADTFGFTTERCLLVWNDTVTNEWHSWPADGTLVSGAGFGSGRNAAYGLVASGHGGPPWTFTVRIREYSQTYTTPAAVLAAGQPNSRPEVVTIDGSGNGTTAHPFADGTLRVYVDNLDQTGALVSQDGTTGDFQLGFVPKSSEQVTVEYLGRGTG